jgi:hypothetical protein
MKAETPENVKSAASTISTPDSASIAESSTAVEASSESSDGAQSSSTSALDPATVKGKQKANDAEAKKSTSSADNLVGKINNLVTTDLGNITDGRDFLLVCKITLVFMRPCPRN